MAKITFDYSAVESYAAKLNRLDKELTKRAVEQSLIEAQELIADQSEQAMQAHKKYSTGSSTVQHIVRDRAVRWTGDVAEISVGFDLEHGGLASVFLMHGTKLHGQPHIKPDRKLYNAVYGSATKKKVTEIQQRIFSRAVEEAMT